MSKKTVVVSLFGSPGAGKSTLAAEVFSLLKKARRDLNVELVTEWVKSWAWEEKTIRPIDQLYILAKQLRREECLLGKVDVVITDSPVWLSPFYGEQFSSMFSLAPVVEAYEEHVYAEGHKRINYYTEREHAYQNLGRYQTEEEAMHLSSALLRYLEKKSIPYLSLYGSDRASQVVNALEEILCK